MPIELTSDERVELERRAGTVTLPFRMVQRARMILYAAEGMQDIDIAARLDCSPDSVARRRSRFCAERIDGLDAHYRPVQASGDSEHSHSRREYWPTPCHNRLACLTWGVRFHGLRGVRLPGCSSRRRGGHGHQHDHGQEHHNGSRGRQPQCLGSRAQARKAKADQAKCGQIFPQMPSPPTAELRGIVQAPVHETPHR